MTSETHHDQSTIRNFKNHGYELPCDEEGECYKRYSVCNVVRFSIFRFFTWICSMRFSLTREYVEKTLCVTKKKSIKAHQKIFQITNFDFIKKLKKTTKNEFQNDPHNHLSHLCHSKHCSTSWWPWKHARTS